MSVFAPGAPQILARQTRILRSQFHAEGPPSIFGLCRRKELSRNDERLSRYSAAKGGQVVQRQRYARRTILAVVLLCIASGLGKAQAGPSAETIARGKALTEAA